MNDLVLTSLEQSWNVGTWGSYCQSVKVSDPDLYVREYWECPHNFNLMVNSIWRYFEFVDSKAGPIEDLYLNCLEFLDLERCNEKTFVDMCHHEAFRNVVLKDELMRQIIS